MPDNDIKKLKIERDALLEAEIMRHQDLPDCPICRKIAIREYVKKVVENANLHKAAGHGQ